MRTRRSVRPVQALAGLLLAAALALTGCTDAGDGGGDSASDARAGAARQDSKEGAVSDESGASQADAPPRLAASHIIRTASLTVQVKDVPKALEEARTTAENAGGYVGRESTTRDDEGNERTRVVLRVPVDSYADVLADLEGAGKLLDRTAKAQDVTEQVVDVDSRIKSQRASVARIRELMDRATKLSDVVTLEGELSRRQADLESLLAQQASLKDRTSLATITLALSETPVKEATGDDDPGVLDALGGGWDAFVTMLRWIVVALAAVLPFAAVLALLVWLWLRLVHPRLSRRPQTVPAMPAGPAPGPLPTARQAPQPGTARPGEED
ncbi:DUF4349 domain-containing protein [Streptomyces sp. TRM68416]|uniref:DUF4349 domain-containing protein n=1 Tax=Streptomyces sp. TRM68416 TaxID=2758412 RepID=UPI001661A8E1|nr:DUF4349 domain-containing protein [Streptomyces sp. TRM68416]MBD0838334.1 DUF4349 domain-containing protein [Streptomyces sp. TRM68416]